MRALKFRQPLAQTATEPRQAASSRIASSQQTAASHAADACAAMSRAMPSRPAALLGRDPRSRSGTSTCASSQSINATRSAVRRTLRGLGSPWTTRVLLARKARPRGAAAHHRLRRHGGEVDPRPGLGDEKVGRRAASQALRPALRHPMQLAERAGNAAPISLRLGRPALHIGHHHQTVDEQPAVRRRDRHRHGSVRLHGRGAGEARSPTRDRRRSSCRDERPPTARGCARSTHRWPRHRRAVRSEPHLHPIAQALPIRYARHPSSPIACPSLARERRRGTKARGPCASLTGALSNLVSHIWLTPNSRGVP